MGLVICCDPVFNSNNIYPGETTVTYARDSIKTLDKKRQKSKDSIERLVMMNLKSKSSSTERSSGFSIVRLERVRTGEKTDSYSIPSMTKVHSNLWIGNWQNSDNEHLLTKGGITHVLSLVGHQSSVERVVRKQKVMDDLGRSDIKYVLDEVYEFMESGQKENNNLLVHCKSGQNRSAVIVIAFLMKKYKIKLFRAWRDVKKARPIVQVNVDYAKQLLDLEREYFGSNSLPSDWMERYYNEATNEWDFLHENLNTDRQKLMFANIYK